MRQIALAAPVLALAAACAEPCTAPALTTSWRFTLADGTREAGCLAAGVATVNLWIDGQAVGLGMACDQGAATFAGLAAGDHAFTMQGVSSGGAVRYQTWGSLTVDGCGETRVLIEPGAGVLRLAYTTAGATVNGLCYAEGDPEQTLGYVWYRLLDRTTGAVASSVNQAASATLLPCRTGADGQVNVPLPWGLYRLSWIQVVTFPLATNPTPIYQACPPTQPAGGADLDVSLVQSGVTSLPVTLSTPVATCP